MKICKYFNECGGCENLNIDYSKQLEYKKKFVKDTLYANKSKCEVNNVVAMKNPFGFRNKVHLAFNEVRGKILSAFIKEIANKL